MQLKEAAKEVGRVFDDDEWVAWTDTPAEKEVYKPGQLFDNDEWVAWADTPATKSKEEADVDRFVSRLFRAAGLMDLEEAAADPTEPRFTVAADPAGEAAADPAKPRDAAPQKEAKKVGRVYDDDEWVAWVDTPRDAPRKKKRDALGRLLSKLSKMFQNEEARVYDDDEWVAWTDNSSDGSFLPSPNASESAP